VNLEGKKERILNFTEKSQTGSTGWVSIKLPSADALSLQAKKIPKIL